MLGGVDGSAGGETRHEPSRKPADDGLVEELLRAVLGAVEMLLRGVWSLACRFPIAAALIAVLAVAVWQRSAALLVVVGVLLAGALLVRLRYPVWWRVQVSEPLRRYRVKAWLRRRWPVLCDRVGLTVTDRDRRSGTMIESRPRLTKLGWTGTAAGSGLALGAVVRLVPGQLVEDLGEVAERLGEAARARQCRITRTGPGTAQLWLQFSDPLAQAVAPLPISNEVDLGAVPVGLREDGGLWRLQLAGTHILIAGVTGSGKGSVIWSLLHGIAPAIHAGVVQVWAVDGKAGMELAPGTALFTRFAADLDTGVALLEDAVAEMTRRAARMAGAARVHVATSADPLLVVLVDEVALLTAYQPDRKLRDRAERALATLATQGRAPGVVLVAALQDPRKEVLGLRNLFPTKIGMRLDERTQVDMVLGDGAREAGAACHKIPDTQPGVAYVKLDGQREPVRVRAAYLDDTAIATLANRYPAHRDPLLVAVPDPPLWDAS